MKYLPLLFLLNLLPLFIANGHAKPERIVSLSLCSDELVLAIAETENIASLSYLSADPFYAGISGTLPQVYLNQGRAEEVIALDPDLIISSRFSASNAISLLGQLDYSVHILGFPADLEASYTQIREVAVLLGEEENGEKLISDMQTTLARMQTAMASQRGKSAVFYANNGFSYGQGTLRDYFLASLGIQNVASELGLQNVGKLPLELLLEAQPDFLLVDAAGAHDQQLANPLLNHPAVRHYFTRDRLIVLPDRYFQCAGPAMMQAYSLMLDALGIPL